VDIGTKATVAVCEWCNRKLEDTQIQCWSVGTVGLRHVCNQCHPDRIYRQGSTPRRPKRRSTLTITKRFPTLRSSVAVHYVER
jgi:hypothetical protein